MENSVQKYSVYSKKERLALFSLTALLSFFLLRYLIWWFLPTHIPHNWSSQFHAFDFILFLLLSFILFIGSTQRMGALLAMWFHSKPVFIPAKKGYKVAFLTCFVPGKEPIEMLEKTLIAMKSVDYPHDTWVLDEGNGEEVKKLCKKLGVKHFSRFGIAKYNQERGLFRAKTKAGNHNAWRDQNEQKYDLVAQVDMDHIPVVDFFERTLDYFNDPKVAVVGLPQYYRNTDNWIARGAAEQAYFFHGSIQQGFFGCDMPFLIGTGHIYRAKAMQQIGGYAPTIVEDHLTGMKFYANGWKGVYIPEILAKGEGPLDWASYFNQQLRWSYGLFEILFKHTPGIIPQLSWIKKINYLIAQLYYFTGVAVVFGMILTFLYLVFGINSASMGLLEWIGYAFPPFLLSNLLQVFIHRFSIEPDKEPIFGPLGMFMNLGANVIYAMAFVMFITNQKLKYLVTPKGNSSHIYEASLTSFSWHIILAALMIYALLLSFFNNHSAIQLRFWALFNGVTLTAVVLSAYLEKIKRLTELFRLNTQPAKYAVSLGLGILVFFTIIFYFPYIGSTTKAYFNNQTHLEEEVPLSGKVLPPDQGAYLGISLYQHNDMNYLNSLQSQTDKKFALIGYYQSWGVAENQFDQDWANNIASNGSIPLITWEPWKPVNGFDRSESVVYQKEYLLKNITSGAYDEYIKQYAEDIKAYKKPIMIRFAHEMNGNWYPWGSTFNEPADYVLAWRHTHEIFDSVGATNVTWVWSPNEAYEDVNIPNANRLELFYPGDDYVDWVGVSAFNWAGSYKQNIWRSPDNLFTYTVTKLKKFNKPVIITETASAELRGDPSQKTKWIKELSVYLQENPGIKGVVWFNVVDSGIDWSINSSPLLIESFKQAFDSYFIKSN